VTTGRIRTRHRAGGTRTWPVGAFLLAVLVGASGPVSAVPSPTSGHPGVLGLSLTAVPVNGNATLVVELRATLDPSSAAGTFDWTFGDGTSYQQVATSYSAVAHEYEAAGAYTAHVFVQSAEGDSNASVSIHVGPTALAVRITAAPTSGSAPLTVNFTSQPNGGTGTYTSFVWRFGDGDNGSGPDLEYTYPTPGTFTATLVVTDTSGATAVASVQLVVAGPSTVPSPSSAVVPPYAEYVIPAVLAIVAITAAAVIYLALVVRRGSDAPPAPAARSVPALAAVASSESSLSGPPSPEEMAGATTSRAGLEDTHSLAERILVHLYWYGRTNIDGVAREDSSQGGMARRLGVAQNSLSKALRRLVDAGALKMELQHVPGAPRRLRTYSLTARGEAVARRIRAEDEKRPPV